MNEEVKNLLSRAESGDVTAQIDLGVCYVKGDGVELDLSKAVYWWTKAADSGNPVAQFNLGLCYINGAGVEVNEEKTRQLWKAAAKQGNKPAITYSKHLFGN